MLSIKLAYVFADLLELNFLASRSYNDLTQYPVFPWVLSSFTSHTLDLQDMRCFRDLSRPIGALDDAYAQVCPHIHTHIHTHTHVHAHMHSHASTFAEAPICPPHDNFDRYVSVY